MSQYPNIPPQQAYDGRPTSSGDESPSLNPMPNPLPGGLPNIPTYPGSASNPPVPAPAYPFGTEHIQQLADFHQQQRQPNQPQQDQQVVQPQQMQQYLQATHQPVSSHQIQMQQMQRYQQQQQPPVQQPQRTIAPQQTRPVTPQQQPQVRLPPPSPSQQSRQTQPIQQHHNFHPALLSNHAVPTGQPQARLHNAIRRPSIPGSQVYTPPVQRLRLPSPIKAEPPAGPSKPTPRRPSPADGREKDMRPRPAPSGATQAVYFAIREPTAREHTHEDRQREREMGRESRVSPAPGEVRRRRDEGMRGSMRNEISKLIYAAGDVPEPDLDSVDYMEDLVVEFIADLCRPIPPIRSNPTAPHQPVPLTAGIIRHRLSSHPFLRKYLDRFDVMTFMSSELAAQRRIVNSTETHFDLVHTVGKEYLGIDEAGADMGGVVKKKRGRPPNPDKERRKPGPQKGFKRVMDPSAPRVKRPYKRRKKAGSMTAGAGAVPLAKSSP